MSAPHWKKGYSMTCPGCSRADTDTGYVLCGGCATRLAVRLRSIPGQYEQIATEYPDITMSGSENAGGRSSPMLINAGLLDLLLLKISYGDTVLDGLVSLEGWCRIVIEERDFTWPHPADSLFGRLTVACVFLGPHVDWISRQPWADEMSSEVGMIDRTLRNALDPYREHVKTGLRCPGAPGEPCGQVLWQDRTDPARPLIACRQCGAEWEPEGWATLAERLDIAVPISAVKDFVSGKNPYHRVHKWLQLGVVANHGTPGAPRVKLAEVLQAQRSA